jgi:hypothetical protein
MPKGSKQVGSVLVTDPCAVPTGVGGGTLVAEPHSTQDG